MKILLIILSSCLLLGGGYWFYKNKIYDPWKDRGWVTKNVINASSALKFDRLTEEEKKFLIEFPEHKDTEPRHVWKLFENLMEFSSGIPLTPYAQRYLDLGCPEHQSSENAENLAEIGGQVLQEKSALLSAQYFEKALALGGETAEAQALGRWAFFAGYGYELANQPDKAIDWYAQSLEHNDQDFRPARQLGMIYYNRAKANPKDRSSRSLARRYLRQSFKLNRSQTDLKALLFELVDLESKQLLDLNPNQAARGPSFPKLPDQVKIPNPMPTLPKPGPVIPQPGINKGFKVR